MGFKNTGRLLSIYCPECKKVTDKISFNLLRETGKVKTLCPNCQRATYIEYNGKYASLYHQDDGFENVWDKMTPAEQKEFKAFIEGRSVK